MGLPKQPHAGCDIGTRSRNGIHMIKPEDNIREKRNFSRDSINSEVYIVAIGDIDKTSCLTCDISEGGIKIVTGKELQGDRFNIVMANQKFPIRVIYREMVEENKFLYGMKFTKPISLLLKKEIIVNLNKYTSGLKSGISETLVEKKVD